MDMTSTHGIFETELGAKISQFIMEHHGDQKYGQMPYTYHLFGVYHMAIQLFGVGCLDTQMGALTHDVFEDTDATFEQLAEVTNVPTACYVGHVSKRPSDIGETNEEYYTRACSTLVSWKIKCSDVLFNMSHSKFTSERRFCNYCKYAVWLIDHGDKMGYDTTRVKQMYNFIVGDNSYAQ